MRVVGEHPLRPERRHVLYWMVATRRASHSFALDRAISEAHRLGRPLVVLEPLRCDYPWASDRLHRFVLDGMRDQQAAFAGSGIAYHPYVEPQRGASKGLLEALAAQACLVVTDDFPTFFLPRMVQQTAARLDVRVEAIDSNGLLPMREPGRDFATAHAFRRHLHKQLPPHLLVRPNATPLTGHGLPPATVPADVAKRWPAASGALLADLSALPIDHTVKVGAAPGGAQAAQERATAFLSTQLARYGEERNEPDADGASGLSPYLHFGHISVHALFAQVVERERWNPSRLGKPSGSREGWWGMSAAAESFLDELITWRELGYGFCAHRPDHDRFESLPPWALATIEKHRRDLRPRIYELEALQAGLTHDRVWNAAQMQLVREGRMHNYLRMLWGKKLYEWSPTPEVALARLIELNNRFAIDGRDPNSYSGIFWTLGRFDRAWGPEREVFGTLRYMSSESTVRKLTLDRYLARWAPLGTPQAAGARR